MNATLGSSYRRRLLVLISFGLILFGGILFNGEALIRALDDRLLEQRMALSPREATGNFAFIAIDKESLDDVGVWPWPRSVYANLIPALTRAGVKDIAFDVDFSAHSTPADDAAFAQALKDAGGGVLLAAFLQHADVEAGNRIVLTTPIPQLAENAFVGGVNVMPDADGILRSVPFGISSPEGVLQSLPVMLSGGDQSSTDSFLVDFSISAASVPTFSVWDVLEGKLPAGALSGKSVIIGAHAVELKDYFTVPVQGTIPGPVIQILAAETLVQGRIPEAISVWTLVSITAGSLAIFFILRPRRLSAQFLLLAAIALAFEVSAFFLFREKALWMRTAGMQLALVMVALGRTIIELDVRRILLRIAALETRNTRQILEQVITDNSDAILIADEGGRIVEMSVRIRDVFDVPAEAGPGRDMAEVLPDRILAEARQALLFGALPDPVIRELSIAGADGDRFIEYSVTPSRLETPEGTSFVVCIAARDVTERRRQQAKLDHLSRYDELTGALRQGEFVSRLDRILADGERTVAVYSLNLHRFKTINTTLGRDVGDELMTKVVHILETCDPGVAFVGRTGSDSFCLAHLGDATAADAEKFADNLVHALGVPFAIGDNRATIGVHIGIALAAPDSGLDGETLLESAEFALDKAREINGSGWSFFDPAASEKIVSARQMERELWRSLEREEIFVTYQPQVRLSDRAIIGAEALVRWNSPKLGSISPAQFVEIAEANGFVEKLGEWVLAKACSDAMAWEKPITVAVNVSPLQFSRGDVVGAVKRALAESGLPPERLQLEITESIFLNRSVDLPEKLAALKALGITLALDDFGTGYSSFGYIAHFPPDKIKVDQLFVRGLEDSAANRAILRSVHSLCEGLGVVMICEGVENEEQLAFLRELGCEQGQGYLFARPQPNEALRELLRSN